MKNQLKSKQQPVPKKSRPSPVAVIISNGSVTDEITVDDVKSNTLLRSLLASWPLCTERPTIHVRKLFSIKNRTVRLRIVLFVAAFDRTFWKRIVHSGEALPDLVGAILTVGPSLPKLKYRRRAREAAIAAALLLHWHQVKPALRIIRKEFKDAELATNTDKVVRQLADIMLAKLLQCDSGFVDWTVQGPINNPYMYCLSG
jgi:hypothetical protein